MNLTLRALGFSWPIVRPTHMQLQVDARIGGAPSCASANQPPTHWSRIKTARERSRFHPLTMHQKTLYSVQADFRNKKGLYEPVRTTVLQVERPLVFLRT